MTLTRVPRGRLGESVTRGWTCCWFNLCTVVRDCCWGSCWEDDHLCWWHPWPSSVMSSPWFPSVCMWLLDSWTGIRVIWYARYAVGDYSYVFVSCRRLSYISVTCEVRRWQSLISRQSDVTPIASRTAGPLCRAHLHEGRSSRGDLRSCYFCCHWSGLTKSKLYCVGKFLYVSYASAWMSFAVYIFYCVCFWKTLSQ
jgi:hypothetical protein